MSICVCVSFLVVKSSQDLCQHYSVATQSASPKKCISIMDFFHKGAKNQKNIMLNFSIYIYNLQFCMKNKNRNGFFLIIMILRKYTVQNKVPYTNAEPFNVQPIYVYLFVQYDLFPIFVFLLSLKQYHFNFCSISG